LDSAAIAHRRQSRQHPANRDQVDAIEPDYIGPAGKACVKTFFNARLRGSRNSPPRGTRRRLNSPISGSAPSLSNRRRTRPAECPGAVSAGRPGSLPLGWVNDRRHHASQLPHRKGEEGRILLFTIAPVLYFGLTVGFQTAARLVSASRHFAWFRSSTSTESLALGRTRSRYGAAPLEFASASFSFLFIRIAARCRTASRKPSSSKKSRCGSNPAGTDARGSGSKRRAQN